ncbi:MAG: hypothetical protein ACM3N9_07540 [Syntrophothermus sp.]
MKNKILLILFSAVLIVSCERDIDKFEATPGSANFSKYIAIGNSLMSGYADGALYHSGQVNSLPNIIAGQLKLAGGGEFVQPMMAGETGLQYPGARPKLVLGYSTACNGVISLAPVPDQGSLDPIAPVGYPVNNFGIPGAKSFHLLAPGYGMMNPYYTRFASNPQTGKVIEDIIASKPTFYTMWLGDNDVLSYALAGGAMDSITSPQFFGFIMGNILGAIHQTNPGVKGVISNIPDITSIPFFTTIPYNGLVLTKGQADSVNMAMALYQLPFVYHEGKNPFLVQDPNSPHPVFKVRQMQEGELVLMTVPQDSLKCKGMGIISRETFLPYPIPGQYILTLAEINAIKIATTAYNTIIAQFAVSFNIGLVDMNQKLTQLKSGMVFDGAHLNTQFVKGGVFSLDGIHLNPRGNAVAANFFIDAINTKYGSTIPHVDITKYQGIIFP